MITDQVVALLSDGQAMTTIDLAAHLPNLAGKPYATDVLRLLLRLDRRFRESKGKWILRAGVCDPSQQILLSAKKYFQTHPRGELLKHLLPAIAVETGQSKVIIEQVILKNYRQVGSMILNQSKEHS